MTDNNGQSHKSPACQLKKTNFLNFCLTKVVQSLESAGLLQEDEMGRKVVEGENSKLFLSFKQVNR